MNKIATKSVMDSPPSSTPGFKRVRSTFQSIRPSDLAGKAGEIAAVLEDRLIAGQYRFGETLSIYALAEQFDASRQPVAAAVIYLRSIGYLEVIPQVGCRVVSPSVQEVIDFFRMYAKVEAVVSGLAAERHEKDEGDRLVELAEQIAASPFKTAEERWNYTVGVTEFHKLASLMARSQTMVERISGLRRISRFYLWQGQSGHEPKPALTDYMNRSRIEVAKAVAARDVDTAERLTETHIRTHPEWVGVAPEPAG